MDKHKSEWLFLSYELSEGLSTYGNNQGIQINWPKKIENGDSSNNSMLSIPTHTGTHIDFPFHFMLKGKNGSDYTASEFIFDKVGFLDISAEPVKDFLIQPENLHLKNIPNDVEILIFKTGFCSMRNTERYWKDNWGWAPETAKILKSAFPGLKAIGFDLISLTSYQQRPIGRVAHTEFLEKHDILIIEDMKLDQLTKSTTISTMIISPLRFTGSEGAPVTVFAEITNKN